jgi:dCTP deaminase
MGLMGILSGAEILKQVTDGRIDIEPFDPKQLNPASYDLRLGSSFAVYKDDSVYRAEQMDCLRLPHAAPMKPTIDSKQRQSILCSEMTDDGLLLKPGVLYLMHTVERIHTKNYVPVLDGKSSIGRLGIFTHVTAGYGDPGFDGQYTLEVVVVHPVRIYPDMRFAQIRFHQLVGEAWDYQEKGHYTGVGSQGPVPSLSWKQFAEDE